MSEPYKTCPACGQPAVLSMSQCGRCGHSYAEPPAAGGAPGRRLSSRSARELRPATSTRCASPWVLLGVPALALALAAAAWVVTTLRVARSAPPAPVTAAIGVDQPSRLANPMSGLFAERPGRDATPTLVICNADYDRLHITLRDLTGRAYGTDCDPRAEATLRVPAGRYTVAVAFDNPVVNPNTGDALFRPYKEYTAAFAEAPAAGPVHLGD